MCRGTARTWLVGRKRGGRTHTYGVQGLGLTLDHHLQFTVTCFQMAVALMWLMVLTGVQMTGRNTVTKVLGLNEPLSWNPLRMGKAVGCAGAFVGMLATGNLCLMFVQVSFYQVARPPRAMPAPRRHTVGLPRRLRHCEWGIPNPEPRTTNNPQAAKSQHILFSLVLSAVFYGSSTQMDIVMACACVSIGFVINAMAEVSASKQLGDCI